MSEGRRTWLAASAAAALAAAAGGAVGAWVSSATASRRDAGPSPDELPRFEPLANTVPKGRRPLNVLLVMSNAERFDLPAGLSLPGHERLQQQAVRFQQWHANTGNCTASRANLYFGQQPQRTGLIAELGTWPPQKNPTHLPSLGHYFRANGYYTAYKGQWQLSRMPARSRPAQGRHPNTRDALEPFGFSDYHADGDPLGSTWSGFRHDAQTAAEAAHWLQTRGRMADKPWLLAVNFVNPATHAQQIESRAHRDFLSPLAGPPFDPLYQARWDFPLPANRQDDLNRKPWAQRNHRAYTDMAFGRLPSGGAAWTTLQNYYFNCIRDVDRHLMTLLNALEASGQAGRTVVVYTSDHGEMAGAHGLRHSGPFTYQEAVRVPFTVRHPDVAGPQQTDALGCAIDLIPTLLELAGCDRAAAAQAYPLLSGVSVAGAVANVARRGERDERGVLFSHGSLHDIDVEHAASLIAQDIDVDRLMPLRAALAGLRPWPRLDQPTHLRGIHTGRYKFSRCFKPSEHHRPADWETLVRHNTLELYDLQKDPLELDNLAHAPEWSKGLVQELNAQLNRLLDKEAGPDRGEHLALPGFVTRL
jgi:arylsulfatase A-like enzyme